MPTLLNNSTQKALTTVARLKTFLGITRDNQDSLFTMLINQVTGFIERYTKRSLLRQTYTNELYDGSGTSELLLLQFPVSSFSTLQENAASDNTSDWQTINGTDYFVDLPKGIIKLVRNTNAFDAEPWGKFLARPQKYRATYTAGYLIDFDNENTPASHTLPQEIEYACLKLCAALWNTRRAEGLTQSRLGDLGVSFKQAIMNDEETRAILDKYAAPTI